MLQNKKFQDKIFLIEGIERNSNLIILCDHASNRVPTTIASGWLGIAPADMQRHIAYDIGAAGVVRQLGKLLDAPIILSNFSRLVIDPNRGEDDPTLIMQFCDGLIIPANRYINQQEKEYRIKTLYRPYHNALAALVDQRSMPILLSIHTFTRQFKNRGKRPWDFGVLFAHDRRLSDILIQFLSKKNGVCIGINQPYCGHLAGDTLNKHAIAFGHLHVLLEICNDLVTTEAEQIRWSRWLAPILWRVFQQGWQQLKTL